MFAPLVENRFFRLALPTCLLAVTLLVCGCLKRESEEVVVYVALDQEFSEPILNDFEASTGIAVRAKYDVESNKTVGLANEILTHRERQRADLFWNNEILHTLRLKQAGLLDVYPTSAADPFPEGFVSPDKDWFGLAARARVLIVNTDRVAAADRPDSIRALIDPRWKGECGLARPFFGTTATHAAVLFSTWGETEARDFFSRLADNALIAGGNKQVAIRVARGEWAFGLTDTDDALIELEKGAPVAIVFPDQEEGGLGTLLIPNTLAIIRGGPNPQHARRLLDTLLQADVEIRLAQSASGQFPLNRDVSVVSRAAPDRPLNVMPVDFEAAARDWERAREVLLEYFE